MRDAVGPQDGSSRAIRWQNGKRLGRFCGFMANVRLPNQRRMFCTKNNFVGNKAGAGKSTLLYVVTLWVSFEIIHGAY